MHFLCYYGNSPIDFLVTILQSKFFVRYSTMPHQLHHKPKNFMNNILDDIFHPSQPICQIIRTNKPADKKDIFEVFRPKTSTCLDYNISQTDMKLDAGNTMIHVQQTLATYVPNEKPPQEKPKKPLRKKVFCSGGPPQWEFVDEIWRREQEEKQKVYRQQLEERLAMKKKKKKRRNK